MVCRVIIGIILMNSLNGGRTTFRVFTVKKTGTDVFYVHIFSHFLSNKFKEIQYRIPHRLHRRPYILNPIDPVRSPLCVKNDNWDLYALFLDFQEHQNFVLS